MIAGEWLEFWKNDKDDKTIQSTVGRLEKHILPKLAKQPWVCCRFCVKSFSNRLKASEIN